jgi:XRE family transcriptional regulator
VNNRNPELVTASGLEQWPEAKSHDAQTHFPELIRRLLVETPEASEISIRTDDGVSLPGYDGEAIIKEPTKLLPAGRLRFEFGTNKDPNKKANEDYNKRKKTASPDEVFIFVTPRRWRNKEKWVSKKQAEGSFKEVKALDADDLELWLQLAPSAHIWISEQLDLHPRDAITLEKWWNDFSRSTRPELPLGLFTAGRGEEAKQLRSLISGEPRSISIRSDWEDDVLGFIAAVLNHQTEADSNGTPPIIVRSAEIWGRITAHRGTGTLIPLFEKVDINRAIKNGRNVVEVLDSNMARRGNADIELPCLNRTEVTNAFLKAGIEWTQADQLARLARRSIPALVREISFSKRIQPPGWSNSSSANILSALMLAGSWTENSAYDDLQVISELAGISLDNLESFILDAIQGSDPAIRRVGNVVMFTSPKQAFHELSRRVSPRLASKWAEILCRVLLESDPLEGLTLDQKLTAQLEGKRRAYSSTLRHGLADSLALAGAINPPGTHTNHVSCVAKKVVANILRRILSSNEHHTWLDITDILPLLAEAAPDVFLSTLEDDLYSDDPSIAQLFQVINDPLSLGSPTKQHYLLRALETLSWSPEYLVRAIQILTKLSRYNLPSNLNDTPLTSMSTILCGWFHNTSADLQTRLQAIDACHSIDPATSLELLKKLWPSSSSTVIPSRKPRYQSWEFNDKEVLKTEWLTFISEMVSRAISWAKENHSILPWLIESITRLSSENFDRIVDFLEVEASKEILDGDIRLETFEKVRDVAIRHKRHHDTESDVHRSQNIRLADLATSLEPSDDLRKFSYLFDGHPELFQCYDGDYEECHKILQEKRHDALNEFFTRPDGWKQLAMVAKRVKTPEQIGWALATYKQSDTIDNMLEWLKLEDPQLQRAASAWTNRYLELNDPAALQNILERHNITGEARELFILSIPTSSKFWNILRNFPSDEEFFWGESKFSFIPREDCIQAIDILLKKNRTWTAISIAYDLIVTSHQSNEGRVVDPKLLVSALQLALSQPHKPNEPQQVASYLGELLDYLENTNTPISDMARLEFGYYNILRDYRAPRALDQMLSSDPSFFVDIVCLAYRGKHEPQQQSDSVDPKIEIAFLVLEGWYGFPGKQKDGTLSEDAMHLWVEKVREQLFNLGRTEVGDELIGQTFAHAPTDSDGIWPAKSIRDLIESISSESFDKGVYCGRINSRGVMWRDVDGRQEWQLAKQYRRFRQTVQAESPRTARILGQIASFYEEEARRRDKEFEISQDLD